MQASHNSKATNHSRFASGSVGQVPAPEEMLQQVGSDLESSRRRASLSLNFHGSCPRDKKGLEKQDVPKKEAFNNADESRCIHHAVSHALPALAKMHQGEAAVYLCIFHAMLASNGTVALSVAYPHLPCICGYVHHIMQL